MGAIVARDGAKNQRALAINTDQLRRHFVAHTRACPSPGVAQAAGLSLGQGESAGRHGSVDFAVLLPERDRSGAQRWLADLQARVDACKTLRAAGLSVSQGLANAWPMTRPTSYSCAPTRP
jgi:hypothetical protein